MRFWLKLAIVIIGFDVAWNVWNMGNLHHEELLKFINSIEVTLNERICCQILSIIYVVIIGINENWFMLS
jgi:hypothetical protein